MRLRGRLWLVVLVVCLGLAPVRAEAALLTTDLGSLGSGSSTLARSFSNDNDVALFSFELAGTTTITAEIPLHGPEGMATDSESGIGAER